VKINKLLKKTNFGADSVFAKIESIVDQCLENDNRTFTLNSNYLS